MIVGISICAVYGMDVLFISCRMVEIDASLCNRAVFHPQGNWLLCLPLLGADWWWQKWNLFVFCVCALFFSLLLLFYFILRIINLSVSALCFILSRVWLCAFHVKSCFRRRQMEEKWEEAAKLNCRTFQRPTAAAGESNSGVAMVTRCFLNLRFI